MLETNRHEKLNEEQEATPLRHDPEILARICTNLPEAGEETFRAVECVVNFFRAYSALYDFTAASLCRYGISPAKFNLLVVLYSAPGRRLPMSRLGEQMSVTRTDITKLVDGLEREHLVCRVRPDGDRRVVLAQITPQGEALTARILPGHYAAIRDAFARITADQQTQLTHLLVTLRADLTENPAQLATPCPDTMKIMNTDDSMSGNN